MTDIQTEDGTTPNPAGTNVLSALLAWRTLNGNVKKSWSGSITTLNCVSAMLDGVTWTQPCM
jgi:hypothetical protein